MIKIIGLIVLIVGITTAVLLVTSGKYKLFSQASNEDSTVMFPKGVIVSNVTDSSFSITYFTPNKPRNTKVYISKDHKTIGVEGGDYRGGDVRHTHYVSFTNLQPNTEYYVKIDSPDEPIKNDYIVQKTASKLGANKSKGVKSFSGRINNTLGFGHSDSLVYFKSENGQFLSTTVDPSGKWKFDLSNHRKSDLSDYLEINKVNQIDILAIAGVDGVAYMKTLGLGADKETVLQLEQPRVPFYGLKLGTLDNSASDLSPAVSAVVQASQNEKKGGGFFETVWFNIKNFFGFK
jgi:hypothetical protein